MSEHRLSEITIERPRSGMRISLKKTTGFKKRLQKLTQDASEDGFLRPYLLKPRNKSKYLSDHINPLRRYLRSHLGHSWNDVFSKLCKRLSSNTLAGQHVRSHIWDFVELHVEMVDGVPYRKASSWRGVGPLYSYYHERFYVHPNTGILCLAAKESPKRSEPRNDILNLDGYRQYRQLNGIWYRVTFREFPQVPTAIVTDVLRKTTISYRDSQQFYGKPIYATEKKQCNKKEIRFILRQLTKRSRKK